MAYIAAQLGHSGTRMVKKQYDHLAPNALAEAIQTLSPRLNLAEQGSVENMSKLLNSWSGHQLHPNPGERWERDRVTPCDNYLHMIMATTAIPIP